MKVTTWLNFNHRHYKRTVALLHWHLLPQRCLQHKAHFISACRGEAEIFGSQNKKKKRLSYINSIYQWICMWLKSEKVGMGFGWVESGLYRHYSILLIDTIKKTDLHLLSLWCKEWGKVLSSWNFWISQK